MAKDALTVLREARELISDPKRWTQGDYARDADGHGVDFDTDEAVCFCSIGAVSCAAQMPDSFGLFPFLQPLKKAAEEMLRDQSLVCDDEPEIVIVNDRLGHDAVLRMFDAAIASAEKEAQA